MSHQTMYNSANRADVLYTKTKINDDLYDGTLPIKISTDDPDVDIISPLAGLEEPVPFKYRLKRVPLRVWALLITLLICLIIGYTDIVKIDPIEKNCLILLLFVSSCWAFEIFPLFITALFVPFLVTVLQVMREGGVQAGPDSARLGAKAAAASILSYMFDQTIMLLIGGFSLAAALDKVGITSMIAMFVLRRIGTDPKWVLLAVMSTSAFLSMWISNVAAPVLLFTIVRPILDSLDLNSEVAKALIVGIALGADCGGMGSPIASPQNAIAYGLESVTITWPSWLIVAVPVTILSVIVTWLVIVYVYKIHKAENLEVFVDGIPSTNCFTQSTPKASKSAKIYVTVVSIITIILWCLETEINHIFGGVGIIAMFPVMMFFGTNILDKRDFMNFMWNVLILAMGGIALGKACQSSGLLRRIGNMIKLGLTGCNEWVITAVFALILGVFATMVSHSVSAAIFLPLLQDIGAGPDGIGHTDMMVILIAFVCSAASGLPISGFPNMQAVSLENRVGKPYIGTKDFLKTGVAASIFMIIIILSVGYGLCSMLKM